jgi:predicted cobalt transporter CbtA
VQYPEPKGPKPFDVYDGIVCIGFAYGYMVAVLSFNVILFFIMELLWAWYVKRRVESE